MNSRANPEPIRVRKLDAPTGVLGGLALAALLWVLIWLVA